MMTVQPGQEACLATQPLEFQTLIGSKVLTVSLFGRSHVCLENPHSLHLLAMVMAFLQNSNGAADM
jgi:hypothetical protein